MESILIYWAAILFSLSDHAGDPVQQAWKGRQEARQLECERMSQAEAHKKYPVEVPATDARATALVDIDALVCTRRMVRFGERDPRDELILTNLSSDIGELTKQAAALGRPTTRWMVDAFYPQQQMVQKIATAARTSLAESGHTVVGQAPLLASGDATVLHNTPVQDFLPIACQRLTAEGTLGTDDAFFALALVRPQESALHAGVCIDGVWRWLR